MSSSLSFLLVGCAGAWLCRHVVSRSVARCDRVVMAGLSPAIPLRDDRRCRNIISMFSQARDAIQREKDIKHRPRSWKTQLIAKDNPGWTGPYDEIVK